MVSETYNFSHVSLFLWHLLGFCCKKTYTNVVKNECEEVVSDATRMLVKNVYIEEVKDPAWMTERRPV